MSTISEDGPLVKKGRNAKGHQVSQVQQEIRLPTVTACNGEETSLNPGIR